MPHTRRCLLAGAGIRRADLEPLQHLAVKDVGDH